MFVLGLSQMEPDDEILCIISFLRFRASELFLPAFLHFAVKRAEGKSMLCFGIANCFDAAFIQIVIVG